MKRNDFLKTLIGIPFIGAFIKKDDQLKFITDGKSYNNVEDAANIIVKKFEQPNWRITGLSRKLENTVQLQMIDTNNNITRWVNTVNLY